MDDQDTKLIILTPSELALPPLIAAAGLHASRRFVEFFTANIRNPNTREAYSRAINAFLAWCDDEAGTALDMIEPTVVAAYVEKLLKEGLSRPTVKQHLAAIRMLFDWLVTGGVLTVNPAAAVRCPKYVIKKGKTPVLTPEEACLLLDSIDISDHSGLRDRALLAVMVYSFARVSAVVGMNVDDYYQQGKLVDPPARKRRQASRAARPSQGRGISRCLFEGSRHRGSKRHAIVAEHDQGARLGDGRMARQDVFRMVKRRCKQAELGAAANCHTFRATGITAYLLNGGTLQHAQTIAAHESPRTTKLYDRTSDEITLDEISEFEFEQSR